MMRKNKKGILNSILGITESVVGIASDVADNVLDIEKIYNIGKDITVSSSNAVIINNKKEKIKKLLIDIGNRVCEKKIDVKDRNVKAEVECIEELLEEKE